VAAKKPYHHGDLRAALLCAVAQSISEKGIEAFSVRECSRRAGASWSAPAHHFGDKTGLLTAFAVQGFERLKDHMLRRREAAEGLVTHAVAIGEGYLEFALRNREHFRVMFRTELLNAQDSSYQAASRSAFQILEDAIKEGASPNNQEQPGTLESRCLLAWSTIHGFATLCLEGAILPTRSGLRIRTGEALEMGQQLLLMLGPVLFTSTI
jgi:AcrR family transcriptional regulator